MEEDPVIPNSYSASAAKTRLLSRLTCLGGSLLALSLLEPLLQSMACIGETIERALEPLLQSMAAD